MEFTYDPALVALSIAIAILGSFTGLVLTAGIRRVYMPEAVLRMGLSSLAVGGGIWAMHFVAMLAVMLPIELSYDVPQTVISALTAIVFTAVAFIVVGWRWFGKYSLACAAVFLGIGIGAMHYIGMNAIRGNCIINYSWLGVVLSLVIAIQASAVALWLAFRERGLTDTLLGAVVLGLAISSMHYAAMEATRFLPSADPYLFFDNVVSETYLALTVSIVVYGICGVCIFVFAALTYARRLAARRQGVAG